MVLERNKVVVDPISLSLLGLRINKCISLQSACYDKREWIQAKRSCLGLLGRISVDAKNGLNHCKAS